VQKKRRGETEARMSGGRFIVLVLTGVFGMVSRHQHGFVQCAAVKTADIAYEIAP